MNGIQFLMIITLWLIGRIKFDIYDTFYVVGLGIKVGNRKLKKKD
jgi:hypothetical protein